MRTLIVGIAGGSGSGKTTLARVVAEEVGDCHALLLSLDNYYRDLSPLAPEKRETVNFDNPDAIDWPLFRRHLRALREATSIEMPIYRFSDHTRVSSTPIEPREVIIIEGIFALVDLTVCELMDVRLFVDTPADIRLARRITRDVEERERTVASVLRQWHDYVRPAYEAFIGPSARHAHLIIPEDPEGGMRDTAGKVVHSVIRDFLAARESA